MKTSILAGFAIAGFLATSVAQAETTNYMVEEIISGLSAEKIQQIHKEAEKPTVTKAACNWHKEEKKDLLYTAYPGSEYTEKTYLSPKNWDFVC